MLNMNFADIDQYEINQKQMHVEKMSTSGNKNNSHAMLPQPLHQGKWTPEEEEYVECLISEFKAGYLPLAEGTSLRVFLSKMLNCDPMRISKKFVGSSYNGKQPYVRTPQNLPTEQLLERRKKLQALEQKFLKKVQPLGGVDFNDGGGNEPSAASAIAAAKEEGLDANFLAGQSGLGDELPMSFSGNKGQTNQKAAAAGLALLKGVDGDGLDLQNNDQSLSNMSSSDLMAELQRRKSAESMLNNSLTAAEGLRHKSTEDLLNNMAQLQRRKSTEDLLTNSFAGLSGSSSLGLAAELQRRTSADSSSLGLAAELQRRTSAENNMLQQSLRNSANNLLDPALELSLQSQASRNNNRSGLSLSGLIDRHNSTDSLTPNSIFQSKRSAGGLSASLLSASGNQEQAAKNWSAKSSLKKRSSEDLLDLMTQLSKSSNSSNQFGGANEMMGGGGSDAKLQNLLLTLNNKNSYAGGNRAAMGSSDAKLKNLLLTMNNKNNFSGGDLDSLNKESDSFAGLNNPSALAFANLMNSKNSNSNSDLSALTSGLQGQSSLMKQLQQQQNDDSLQRLSEQEEVAKYLMQQKLAMQGNSSTSDDFGSSSASSAKALLNQISQNESTSQTDLFMNHLSKTQDDFDQAGAGGKSGNNLSYDQLSQLLAAGNDSKKRQLLENYMAQEDRPWKKQFR